jgi:glycosyl-4,4'-diaponeurosporenoate acyltransferase
MVIRLILINAVSWLVLQLSIAAAVTRISAERFANDNLLYHVRAWEIGFYRRWLRIRKWKRMLPDGAPWVGGSFSKKHLDMRDTIYLQRFAVETRRGEIAHWLMLFCFPLFYFWNPPWALMIIAVYAVAANLPCIFVQRYNRETIRRLLLRHRTFPDEGKSSQI